MNCREWLYAYLYVNTVSYVRETLTLLVRTYVIAICTETAVSLVPALVVLLPVK